MPPLDREVAEILGVCSDCVMKHPSLHKRTHSGMFHEAGVRDREEDPRARRIREAKERRKTKRLIRQLHGEHTRVRKALA